MTISYRSSEQAVLFPDATANNGRIVQRRGIAAKKATPRASANFVRPALLGLDDPGSVVFLDVETTGLSWFYDELTLVGWARDGAYHVHVAGEDRSALLSALASARALVTFNGTLFDLKFLRKSFGDVVLPPVHIDLRYLARRVGLVGGQKRIEAELGIGARAGVEELDGAAAVLLWHEFLRGRTGALHRLIDYNRRDVLAMCMILDHVVDRLDVQPDLWRTRSKFEQWARPALEQKLPLKLVSKRKPRLAGRTFASLFGGTRAENAKVVGIDLTGSEKRASGFCVLSSSQAHTATVNSDEEMLARVLTEKPDLISIDSPLSLPEGRIRVSDDDPGRAQFGIMRRCERELKRRGINVYPCLLPSMQGLTQRGTRLAESFRKLGIPVIESYPGAAQDIMGIPRKGAGEAYLKQGLSDFGIRGQFEKAPVSHDELDAITAAVVGSFFLSGRFEALRGPTEGALIIPDLKSKGFEGLVVGISGRICAGKTTAARILERGEFAYTRFSLVVDDEIIARGEVPDRATRQRVGAELHAAKGQRWLGERVIARVAGNGSIVVDGLRFPEDHAFLSETFGTRFIHLHITAPEDIRAGRYGRDTRDSSVSFEQAENQPVEAEIDRLASLAEIIVANDGSLDDLSAKLSTIIAAAKQERGCLSPSS